MPADMNTTKQERLWIGAADRYGHPSQDDSSRQQGVPATTRSVARHGSDAGSRVKERTKYVRRQLQRGVVSELSAIQSETFGSERSSSHSPKHSSSEIDPPRPMLGRLPVSAEHAASAAALARSSTASRWGAQGAPAWPSLPPHSPDGTKSNIQPVIQEVSELDLSRTGGVHSHAELDVAHHTARSSESEESRLGSVGEQSAGMAAIDRNKCRFLSVGQQAGVVLVCGMDWDCGMLLLDDMIARRVGHPTEMAQALLQGGFSGELAGSRLHSRLLDGPSGAQGSEMQRARRASDSAVVIELRQSSLPSFHGSHAADVKWPQDSYITHSSDSGSGSMDLFSPRSHSERPRASTRGQSVSCSCTCAGPEQAAVFGTVAEAVMQLGACAWMLACALGLCPWGACTLDGWLGDAGAALQTMPVQLLFASRASVCGLMWFVVVVGRLALCLTCCGCFRCTR